MFKRLTKARRHSADEIGSSGGVLPSPLSLHEPPGRKNSEGQIIRANGPAATYMFATARSKLSRKSCGDAYALLNSADDDSSSPTPSANSMQSDTDYRLVTAVPAFIVEHEPEKHKGLANVWGFRRMSKKIDSFRRSSSRETICGTIPEHNNKDIVDGPDKKAPLERRFLQNSTRSPSPFKSFFIRMGSTGMLNTSSKSRRASQNLEEPKRSEEKENLFRSCSTSQLNTSPTYVKGDDPSEGIDLRITAKNEKTVSCDNLSGKPAGEGRTSSFVPCDFKPGRNDFMRKSSSCDFKETKKGNFPYAFLRSRLSVLPEERNYNGVVMNGSKEDRLFKTASEEHFPAMKIEDTFEGTTTLGRRRTPKSGYPSRDCNRYRLQDPSSRYARNSYSEERYESKESRYFSPVNLAMVQNGFEENCRNSISLPYQGTTDLDFDSASNNSALLRNSRRNSSGEQRLSSHYVSSNESGYDSDGPRGESGEPLKCSTTDSSDTSSVVDSELEKPMRSSTPSEDAKDETLVWNHQAASGRILPSIHQSTTTQTTTTPKSADAIQASAHRMRLQQDKTRFLTDIIQPPKRMRRCRLVSLSKTDPKESLGIRLAQQRHDEVRYVIVQLEADGIAHRDGRLRLGDEIVEVEGKDLRTMSSLEEVQDFLRSCEGTMICLKTAYEETVPQIYLNEDTATQDSSNRQTDTPKSHCLVQTTSCPKEIGKKRPDYLPLESTTTTRHVARFEKGLGKPSLGFSVVGGRDSPRGEMGIFVRRVFPGGQADVSKTLFQGDEILSFNGKVLQGCTHREAIELFKAVREGAIELELARRHRYHKVPLKTAPY
ncbi:PDZ domain-containing protein 2-like [Phymastichus coffea]|uniref:PDZ domain-containing protein 2-like n=1 Tax=Phymastichus coffea TaxID=108790 RepID=UPI00273C4322|nr:PDZ domain-containing protein 2-like [Phymastichus coffea]